MKEIAAGIIVTLIAIWGVIATMMNLSEPKDEDHEANEPHAGGKT